MINLGVFALVILTGVGMSIANIHRVQRIDASCGFQTNCIRLYSLHHIGITQWWPTIFNVGITGSGVALIGLLVVSFAGREDSGAVSSNMHKNKDSKTVLL